jgi:diguanylate cyclase (GGDEF)-like protein
MNPAGILRDDAEQAVAEHTATVAANPDLLSKTAQANQPLQTALHITAVLQTTLDLGRLIELFAREVRAAVPHEGVCYSHDDLGVFVEEGAAARHACTYRLTVEDQTLGQIRFMRRNRFQEPELAQLEYLLCSLVYPLRNALEHRTVLDEARRCPLTGVLNRGALDALLRREVGLAHRHKIPFTVIFLDLDRFKAINDNYGHAVGDRAIRLFTEVVTSKIRTTDILVRYGGDEFVILLTNTPLDGAALLAERICEAVAAADASAIAPGLKLTSSLGVATLHDTELPAQLLDRADTALNQAKQQGRNRVNAG